MAKQLFVKKLVIDHKKLDGDFYIFGLKSKESSLDVGPLMEIL